MIDDLSMHPRPGPLGLWDDLVGPGADPVETGLIVGAMIAGAGLAVAWAIAAGADWAWWRWAVLVLLAGELLGGVASNAMAPAKRWNHRPGRGPLQHFGFAALHIHPFVLALAAPESLSLRAALIVYGLLLAGAGLVIATPTRLKGAAALLFSSLAIAFCSGWLPMASPLGWLPAVLFLKVIVGYLVPMPERSAPKEPPVYHGGPWG